MAFTLERLSVKRLLLTGGSGFIGQAVLRRLQTSQRPLRIVVRSELSARRLQEAGLTPRPQDEVVTQDLTQRFALPRLLEGCDALLHLAGRTRSQPGERKAYYADQVVATAQLLEAALAAKLPRVVVVSPAHAIGTGTEAQPATEASRWDLSELKSDWIQASRLRELEVMRAATLGLPLVFVNPTFCLGPGDPHDSQGCVLGPLRQGIPLTWPGHVNLLDVRDAAAGIVSALELGGIGRRYLLGGTQTSFQGLASLWFRHTSPPPKLIVMPQWILPGHLPGALRVISDGYINPEYCALVSRHWWYSDTYARQMLLHQSRPLEETLSDVKKWIANH